MATISCTALICLVSILLPYAPEQAANPTQPREAMAPGVYLKLPGRYLQVEPEALTWRTGSLAIRGNAATLPVTGRAHGGSSRFELSTPAEFLVVLPEQVAQAPFTLLKPDLKEDRRDFAVALSWRGGRYESWSGKKNATISLDIKELSRGAFSVGVPALPKGEYGFLLPTFLGKAGMPAEKVYTFRTPLTLQDPGRPAATADASAIRLSPGVKVQRSDGEVWIEPEVFEWFPHSFTDTLKAHLDTATKRTRGLLDLNHAIPDRREYVTYHYYKVEQMNGTLGQGPGEPMLAAGAGLILYSAEGTDAADYRLVAVENKSGERNLRVDAFFVNLELSSVAYDNYLGFGKRDSLGTEPIPFQAEKVADRQYRIILPMLKPGHYGLLGPGTAALGHTGSLYAFEIR